MPELRKDPIIGRWVIISVERGRRPSDFNERVEMSSKKGFCPFCPGNEATTPEEIFSYRDVNSKPNTPGWTLRIVPNKFPALRIEGDLNREGDGVFDKMSGIGAHEVIIESPNHYDSLSKISLDNFANVLYAFKERILELKKDRRFRYVLIFKNYGEAAGASLEHSHSQLIALPIVPKRVIEEFDGSKEYYNYKERCIFCDIIRQERREGIRVINENDYFISITPFAPRFPFETWILPKYHSSHYEELKDYKALAEIFSDTLKRLDKTLNIPPYNFILHNSSFKDEINGFYHWHFEIMPKLIKIAGFEWGSGFYINPTPPEESAKFLREAKI